MGAAFLKGRCRLKSRCRLISGAKRWVPLSKYSGGIETKTKPSLVYVFGQLNQRGAIKIVAKKMGS